MGDSEALCHVVCSLRLSSKPAVEMEVRREVRCRCESEQSEGPNRGS